VLDYIFTLKRKYWCMRTLIYMVLKLPMNLSKKSQLKNKKLFTVKCFWINQVNKLRNYLTETKNSYKLKFFVKNKSIKDTSIIFPIKFNRPISQTLKLYGSTVSSTISQPTTKSNPIKKKSLILPFYRLIWLKA
jgi:hypothetical protein